MRELAEAVEQLWARLAEHTGMPAPTLEQALQGMHGDIPDPTDRNLNVRVRLLAAGAALLLEAGRENLHQALNVQRVARRAAASRQSWHNQFPDHDYLEALAVFAVDPATAAEQAQFFRAAVDAYVENQPMGVAVPGGRQLLEMLFEQFRTDDRYRLQLLLAAVAPDDPGIAGPLRARAQFFLDLVPQTYERMFRHALFEPRPPHTHASISVAIGAITDGFILRSSVDPENANLTRAVDAVIALLSGALVTVGDGPEHPPLRGPFDAAAPHLRPDEVAVTTDAIVRAAVEVFSSRGTRRATLADIADHLHCSEVTLVARYRDVSALALEAWTAVTVPDMRLAVEGADVPTAKIRGALVALARQSIDCYWLTSAVLRARHDAAEGWSPLVTDLGIDACVDIVAPLLLAARTATRNGTRGGIGDLDDEQLHRLAQRLVTQTLLDVVGAGPPPVLSRPALEDQAEQVAAEIWDVCLPGLRRPRPNVRSRTAGRAPGPGR